MKTTRFFSAFAALVLGTASFSALSAYAEDEETMYGDIRYSGALNSELGIYAGDTLDCSRVILEAVMYDWEGKASYVYSFTVGSGEFAELYTLDTTQVDTETPGDYHIVIRPAAGENGSFKVTTADHKEFTCRAVILATGAKNRHLGIAREDELVGRGVSYCATCDGMFFRKKDVAVNGGGNTALGDALYLAGICNKVYLIHRRDQFRGAERDAEKLEQLANVEFVLNSTVTGLNGDAKLESIDVTNKNTGDVKTIPVSGLFVAIGQEPDNNAFSDLVNLDARGYISAGESCHTSHAGVFAAGDCRTKSLRQLTTAAADGAIAATAACEYIDRL